ncbi:MAG: YfbM family protein [Chitinophagales bacterium]|nr:YfbM family protein [Chitinophagales bacterium]
MSCLGVLFSLDKTTVDKLKSFKDDNDRLDYLQEKIEEPMMNNEPERFAELDKAWDALHRSLTDGTLDFNNGAFPLNHVVMGGEILYRQDDYIMILKTPDQVQKIAEKIETVTEAQLRTGYNSITSESYGMPTSDDDFDYTWEWFQESIKFWKKAAEERRYVLFTADQ